MKGGIMFELNVNKKNYNVDVDGETSLLWVLREFLKLTGTKYGCGVGICGTCTVLVDGKAARSCQIAVKDAVNKKITTIEGIDDENPVKKAWIEEEVPQCGYCQPGQIMQAISFLSENPHPDEKQIKIAMSNNLCRCGTYPKIISAVKKASGR
jgi:aerobic-type carbon monoxide dehydrogenase small subunit (CoxS/CutS family)